MINVARCKIWEERVEWNEWILVAEDKMEVQTYREKS
jgi:hypothetical protein